ncbi:MAG: azurin [Rhodanobacter sp.]
MNIKMTVLAVSCVLALSACSDKSSTPAASDVAPAATVTAPMEAPAAAPAEAASAPVAMTATPSAATPAADGVAVVTDCATEVDATDSMQYNVSSIVVPASCKDFKITLKHTGTMPVAAMGHDLVIAKKADMSAVDADGIAAGASAGYVKADDTRVIAHTKLIGGGETTSISFPVSKIQSGGPYEFFCTFPGHSSVMHGSISVQ